MRKIAKLVTAAASIATLVGTLALLPTGSSIAADNSASAVDQGKKLSFNRKKGNCLACHQIAGGNMAGNIGPPLVAMKARFPDKSKLRSQIWDATKANPNSAMPPFGRHKILSDKDIDKIVEYVYTL